MAFKLIEAAQERWHAVNAPLLVALVRAGARFERGKLVERDPALDATQALANASTKVPAASEQPVNNAA
jgi:putative transposase